MPDKSKFEREIDEILDKTSVDAQPRDSKRKDAGKKNAFEPFSPSVPKRKPPGPAAGIKFNTGQLIIVGLILVALAAFLPVAKLPLAAVGIAVVIVGYVQSFRKGSRGSGSMFGGGRGRGSGNSQKKEPEVKYWRGRRIEPKSDQPKPQSDDRGKIIDFGSPDDEDSEE